MFKQVAGVAINTHAVTHVTHNKPPRERFTLVHFIGGSSHEFGPEHEAELGELFADKDAPPKQVTKSGPK
jgi:hypothetical protein